MKVMIIASHPKIAFVNAVKILPAWPYDIMPDKGDIIFLNDWEDHFGEFEYDIEEHKKELWGGDAFAFEDKTFGFHEGEPTIIFSFEMCL